MKKLNIIASIALITAFVVLASGCSAEEDDDANEWRSALSQFIQEIDQDTVEGFDLISLDKDDIPELVVYGQSEADGVTIAYFSNGEYSQEILARKGFSYIPESGKLLNSDGNMGHYYDILYELKDGKLLIAEKGTRSEGGEDSTYIWNGENLSAKDYKEELAKVYDKEQSVNPHDDGVLSKDEALKEIE